MSSSEIYGNPIISPTPENYIPLVDIDNPRSSYIISKMLAEVLLKNKANKYNIKICRISLTYGPGSDLDDKRVIQQFINKARNGEIKMLDQGDALRTFCYIRDSLEMILNVTFNGKHTTYNIANPFGTVSILSLAQTISELIPKSKISLPTEELGTTISVSAPKSVIIDITKYENEFGRIDFLNLKEGLKKIIDYDGK